MLQEAGVRYDAFLISKFPIQARHLDGQEYLIWSERLQISVEGNAVSRGQQLTARQRPLRQVSVPGSSTQDS